MFKQFPKEISDILSSSFIEVKMNEVLNNLSNITDYFGIDETGSEFPLKSASELYDGFFVTYASKRNNEISFNEKPNSKFVISLTFTEVIEANDNIEAIKIMQDMIFNKKIIPQIFSKIID